MAFDVFGCNKIVYSCFREGIVTSKPAKESKGSYVNIGLLNDCMVDTFLSPGLRVTVKLEPNQGKSQLKTNLLQFLKFETFSDLRSRKIKALVVSPSQPRSETGIYWGYSVRVAASLSDIFTKSPYEDGYDLTIGTSDKGKNVHSLEKASLPYNHALIVYGGLQGLESALDADEKLTVEDPSLLFHEYINTVPDQGSRTIRTEEAILISLAALEEKFAPIQMAKSFIFTDSIPQSKDTGVRQYDHKKKEPAPVTNQSSGSLASVAVKTAKSLEEDDTLSRFD